MSLPELSPEEYDALADRIASAESPVGIDAKKTHVVILHLLLDLQKRLIHLEQQLADLKPEKPGSGI